MYMHILYAYRYILYFVLAVKENKDPAYIGKYITFYRHTKPRKALICAEIKIGKDTNTNEHPYKNLMKRCGLKPKYVYPYDVKNTEIFNAFEKLIENKNSFFIEVTNIKNSPKRSSKEAVDKIRERWKHVSIASLVAAHEYMGDELFVSALDYIRNPNNSSKFILGG